LRNQNRSGEQVSHTNIIGSSVDFGHTNVLNGQQWVEAFTTALQTGKPERYDASINGFRKENLVLITNDARTILVVTPGLAEKFRRK